MYEQCKASYVVTLLLTFPASAAAKPTMKCHFPDMNSLLFSTTSAFKTVRCVIRPQIEKKEGTTFK